MKLKLMLCIGMVSLFFCGGAQAQEIPDEIKKLVPIHPDAKVTSCQATGDTTQVKLKTAADPKAIFNWYKTKMTADGWKIIHERDKENNYRLVMNKDDRQFGFGVHKLPDRDTRFFFSIKKLDKKSPETHPEDDGQPPKS